MMGRTTWVLSDGKIGMENQCIGLAEALGARPEVRRIVVRQPWRSLPPHLWLWPMAALSPAGAQLAPPWPDLLIATGKATVAPALAIKRASGGRTFCVQIQDPTIGHKRFDLIIVPRHDRLRGDNVLVTRGSLHRVTPARLAEGAATFGPALAHLPRPRVAVLVGGANKVYGFDDHSARTLADGLVRLVRDHGCGLMVTTSRRTGPRAQAILDAALATLPPETWHAWTGDGPNPYFGYLALADGIVATADSVNMVCEAATTGKPVWVAELAGGSDKFHRFHESLREDGLTRPFTGIWETWTYGPLDDVPRAAEAVGQKLAARQASGGLHR